MCDPWKQVREPCQLTLAPALPLSTSVPLPRQSLLLPW